MKTKDFSESTRTKLRPFAKRKPSTRVWQKTHWLGVALAAVGLLLSAKAIATIPKLSHSQSVSVSKRYLSAGTVISIGDFTSVNISSISGLPGAVLAGSLTYQTGRVLKLSLTKGAILYSSETSAATSGRSLRLISFAVPESHALGGALVDGDRIDVMATSGSGASSITTVLGRALLVTSVLTPPGGLGSPSDLAITLTVACPDSMDALAIANGASSATLWIDLANAANPPDDSGTYQVSFTG